MCEAFGEDKNDVNEGVEEAVRVCAALAGAAGKEGIVVDGTMYGCALSKSSSRGTRTIFSHLARGVETISQRSRLWHKVRLRPLRPSGAGLPRGLHISDYDAR